jgi:hypothetical protein
VVRFGREALDAAAGTSGASIKAALGREALDTGTASIGRRRRIARCPAGSPPASRRRG